MHLSAKREKIGVFFAMVLAAVILLCFLMGNTAPVAAASSDAVFETRPQYMYGADVLIPVDIMVQNPELPNGCEATALTMLLRHAGYRAGKEEIAMQYMPRMDLLKEEVDGQEKTNLTCGDPEKVYCGDPTSEEDGFYCFQGPVITALNQYLAEQASTLTALDMSGAPEGGLIALIDEGTPVMIWCTLKMDTARRSTKTSWTVEETGETYVPYSNLHSMVLVGYNDDLFYLNDPLQGLVTCPRDMVMKAFRSLGSRAVILR